MTRPFCQTCARKYGKELWEGSCVCSGHVSLTFEMPGGYIPHHDWKWTPPEQVHKEKAPTVRKRKAVKPKEFRR